MKTGAFLNQLEHGRVVAAIQAAEKKTSGEIRVFVSRDSVSDPLAQARDQFTRLKMDQTRERNGVLIFIAPTAQKFAVIGDEGIHTRCGQEFWDGLVAEVSARFKAEQFTEGLVSAIEHVGDVLGRHFPCRPDDRNELSDTVEEG